MNSSLQESPEMNVEFLNISNQYLIDSPIDVHFKITGNYVHNVSDWIGLFNEGWTSRREYLVYAYATKPKLMGTGYETVTSFQGKELIRSEDGCCYQFCYITSDGRVIGKSSTFQFKHDLVEDLSEFQTCGESFVDSDHVTVCKASEVALRQEMIINMEGQIHDYENKLSDSQKEKTTLEYELIDWKKYAETTRSDLIKASKQVNYLNDLINKNSNIAKSKFDYVQSLYSSSQEHCRSMECRLEEMKVILANERKRSNDFETLVLSNQKQNFELKKRNEILNKELEEITNGLETLMLENQQQNVELNRKTDTLRKEIEETKNGFKTVILEQNIELMRKNEILDKELERTKNNFKTSIFENQKQYIEFTQKNESLNKELGEIKIDHCFKLNLKDLEIEALESRLKNLELTNLKNSGFGRSMMRLVNKIISTKDQMKTKLREIFESMNKSEVLDIYIQSSKCFCPEFE